MTALSVEQRKPERDSLSWLWLGGTLLLSVVIHAVTFINLPNRPPERAILKPLDVEIKMVEPPKPPPPPPPEPEKPPEPPKPKLKPPPIKIAEVKPPPLPPPSEPPPEPPKNPPPVVVGLSLSNTNAAGSFAAPVGNTAYGKVADKAVDPNSVKPYTAPANYVPAGGADTEPELIGEVKVTYPEGARKDGIEGSVRMKVTVDDQGHVVEVTVLSGPGYGLNEAAKEALKHFRFKPAMKHGAAVATTFPYTYTFLLD